MIDIGYARLASWLHRQEGFVPGTWNAAMSAPFISETPSNIGNFSGFFWPIGRGWHRDTDVVPLGTRGRPPALGRVLRNRCVTRAGP